MSKIKKKVNPRYDSGLDGDDEADGPTTLTNKGILLIKQQLVESVRNNNLPDVAVTKSNSKPQNPSKDDKIDMKQDEDSPAILPVVSNVQTESKIDDGASVRFQLMSMIQDLTISDEETVKERNNKLDHQVIHNRKEHLEIHQEQDKKLNHHHLSANQAPVMHNKLQDVVNALRIGVDILNTQHQVKKDEENNSMKKRRKSKSKSKSKQRERRSRSKSFKHPTNVPKLENFQEPAVVVEPEKPKKPEPLPSRTTAGSNVITNMSLTQNGHSWGQLKLIQAHLPPWKQINPYAQQENEEDEEEIPKPKKSIAYPYPSVLERGNSNNLNSDRQPLNTKSTWSTLKQAYGKMTTSLETEITTNVMQSSSSSPQAPKKHFLVPLPPYPIEYSRLNSKSKRTFQTLKRNYPRPWVQPIGDVNTSRIRQEYEQDNERARRILHAMWRKEEEEEQEALHPTNNKPDNPVEVLHKINSEMAMIDRLLKEIHGQTQIPLDAQQVKQDIFYNYNKERQELEMARRNNNLRISSKSKRLSEIRNVLENNESNKGSKEMLANNNAEESSSKPRHQPQPPSSKPVFDSDFDLPDILKPNFEYLYQTDVNKFHNKKSNTELLYHVETDIAKSEGSRHQNHNAAVEGSSSPTQTTKNSLSFIMQANPRNSESKPNSDTLVYNSLPQNQSLPRGPQTLRSYGNQNQWGRSIQNSEFPQEYLVTPPKIKKDIISDVEENENYPKTLGAEKSKSYTVPVGQRIVDRHQQQKYKFNQRNDTLESESDYTPPPHIEQNLVDRFFTSMSPRNSRRSEIMAEVPENLTRSKHTHVEPKSIEKFFKNTSDYSKAVQFDTKVHINNRDDDQEDDNDEESLLDSESELLESSESIVTSDSESDSDGTWVHLPTPSDEVLLKTQEVTADWLTKIVEINNSNQISDVYPVIQTLFASSGIQRQSQVFDVLEQSVGQRLDAEQTMQKQSAQEKLRPTTEKESSEILVQGSSTSLLKESKATLVDEIKLTSEPDKVDPMPLNSDAMKQNVTPTFRNLNKPPINPPVVKHVKAWNAPPKPPVPSRYVPRAPARPRRVNNNAVLDNDKKKKKLPRSQNPNSKKKLTNVEKDNHHLIQAVRSYQNDVQNTEDEIFQYYENEATQKGEQVVPYFENEAQTEDEHEVEVQNIYPASVQQATFRRPSRIPRSLHWDSVYETTYPPQPHYKIREFITRTARIKSMSHVLRRRVMSAPPDLHLDFSSSLIDLRVPTARDFNQVLRGCKSFFF